ncbi:helix-turn-helix domain-containing protein [Pedobacter helvus]|uniref:Helix-turn-helix domain-containing protein n=1 Tax=Pedobacter helvus TaxID=2563444 RepID=A0ABW9JFA8_9SPHI|nr:helix-turn-helix transcriptional regulator [Pedobacter ureilyticus]
MKTNELNSKNFSDYIRKLRRERHLSQQYMANAMGVSQNTYWLLENGKTKITLEHIQQLADALNLNVRLFLHDFINQ